MMLISFLLIISSAYLVSTERNNGTHYARFIEAPVDDNRSILIDLEQKPNMDLYEKIRNSQLNKNKYMLYTRSNPKIPQYIAQGDDSVKSSNFNPNNPTMVLIHGWQSHTFGLFDVTIKEALLKMNDTNVIVVDWDRISSLDYATAVIGVPSVGRNVGRFLDYLNRTTGAPLTTMHLVGHSLGAHVAGNAGRELDGRVARITGLDPAGPLWTANSKRLKPNDAIYVEAIHTNGLSLGIATEIADVDFFVNGGMTRQPGCLLATCNHSRSYQLFAASIEYPNNRLRGTKCTGYSQMILNKCNGQAFSLGNNELNKRGEGVYRLNTGSKYPF